MKQINEFKTTSCIHLKEIPEKDKDMHNLYFHVRISEGWWNEDRCPAS